MFSVLGPPRKVIDTILESSTHGDKKRMCDFREFLAWYNNSKDCSISGVFSALGKSRKVVDMIFESSYSLGTIIRYAMSRIFQHGLIYPVE